MAAARGFAALLGVAGTDLAAYPCYLSVTCLPIPSCSSLLRPFEMFFVIERWESVALRPSQLGPEYLASVEALLRQQVEGKCLQSVG